MHVTLSQKSREKLLNDLCVRYGFCLPPEGHNKILDDPPSDLSAFVDLVFQLEGLNPETADLHLKRKIRDLIVDADQSGPQGAA